jgi:hypothetical protein
MPENFSGILRRLKGIHKNFRINIMKINKIHKNMHIILKIFLRMSVNSISFTKMIGKIS